MTNDMLIILEKETMHIAKPWSFVGMDLK